MRHAVKAELLESGRTAAGIAGDAGSLSDVAG